ncbi:MAG TPA: ATP-dependent DNA helicase RecG [Methylocella sp.]|nr:ATP-dependent DNA helicase RecG [Methylocella sp.]
MRPSLLNPLFTEAQKLSGVGPKTAQLLDRLLADDAHAVRVIDLLFHLPFNAIDRRNQPKIAEAPLDSIVTIKGTVAEHRPPGPRSRSPYRILLEDETGDILLVFFLANHAWIERSLPLGATRWVSGKLELWEGHRQMVHPDRVLDAEGFAKMALIEPVYPSTEGLTQKTLARAIDAALTKIPALPEWQAAAGLSFADALRSVHHPQTPEAVKPESAARGRLAYDELLASQLALALMRGRIKRAAGRVNKGDGHIRHKIIAALLFALTASQKTAIAEIEADLAAPTRMLRLLQGDVGSGKTIVALLAMAAVVEAGRQAALMAPTEILARQHYQTLAKFGQASGLRLALLTGRDKGAGREAILSGLAEGGVDIVIGTHALFQESVAFRDLSLAVVDEQHRFGVHQRLALGGKSEAADILVMTATPIPRSLVLTYFGDMDVSNLREKPAGRQGVETRALPTERLDELIARLRRAIAEGTRAFWVCPLVEESEALDVAAAEERFDALRKIFGDRVGLVHGKMKSRERDATMAAFAQGSMRILVATTVIEVGVDIPQATIMVIEHAERFGLSQLHQLRGRVGRGGGASFCLLLYKPPLSEAAKARLSIMRETDDGFLIAEEDLRLRGEGDVLGTKQSGLPGFRLADLSVHAPLLKLAREEARRAAEENPRLEGARGEALRLLLNIFELGEAIRLLGAG